MIQDRAAVLALALQESSADTLDLDLEEFASAIMADTAVRTNYAQLDCSFPLSCWAITRPDLHSRTRPVLRADYARRRLPALKRLRSASFKPHVRLGVELRRAGNTHNRCEWELDQVAVVVARRYCRMWRNDVDLVALGGPPALPATPPSPSVPLHHLFR